MNLNSVGLPAPTAAEVQSLPAVVDVPTAAAILQIGRTAAYDLIRAGRWPTPVLWLGHRIRLPTAPLLTLLGLSTEPPAALPPPADSS